MRIFTALILVLALFITAGCAINVYKKSPGDRARIEELSAEVERLKKLQGEEEREFAELKRELEKQLRGKIGVDIEKKGLVITLANNILFDSGKAQIKEDAYPVLNKIANLIKTKAPNKNIGIEGHTDNVPIKYSDWKSNRELSTARANNVYHYLVDNGLLSPSKSTTIGYGEFQPVASNDTEGGRAKNRRVEIVILPQYTKKAIEELEKQQKELAK